MHGEIELYASEPRLILFEKEKDNVEEILDLVSIV
jgi:hypothetical protein